MEDAIDKDKEVNGVSIANFDYSVDNFISYVDSVSDICGLPTGESNQRSQEEIEYFQSMTTFLKEWKYFVYEPKTVNFAYETEPGKFKDEFVGITLPQFSSAAVPKNEPSPNTATNLDSDFILNAGGLVWAFDWCPQNSGMTSSIQCEYLAVAAHPPGSTYHKIGVPLLGRGVIQIWCLLTLKENMELSLLKKGRGRKKLMKEPIYDSEGKEVLLTKRPRGRPRKSATSRDHLNGLKDITPEKPEVRAGKQISEKESSHVRPRERPEKRKNIVAFPASSNEKSCVKRPRGRPRKELKATVNRCVQASGLELAENICALRTSRDPETSNENAESLPESNLNGNLGTSLKRPGGRPRKGLTQNMDKCVQQSGLELGNIISSLPTPTGPGTLSENVESQPMTVDLSNKTDSSVADFRVDGLSALTVSQESEAAVNRCVQASGIELGDNISALLASRAPETFSRNGDSLPMLNSNGNFESPLKRRRGRPRKGLTSNGDKCGQQTGSELGKTISSLSTSAGCEILSKHVKSQSLSSDLCNKIESSVINFRADGSPALAVSRESEALSKNFIAISFPANSKANLESLVPSHRENPRRKSNKVAKQKNNTFSVAVEEDLSMSASGGPEPLSKEAMTFPVRTNSNDWVEDKELEVTVLPTSDDQRNGEMVPRKEVTQVMSLNSKETSLPKLVLCLGHMGKVAWDVKWRPCNANDLEGKHRLGYLAALLGNGALEVWEVPLPSMVRTLFTSCCQSEGSDPRFLKLKPIFRCSKVNNGNSQSIPLTLEWSTSSPHDLLLAGCHDGTVAMWKFSTHHSDQDIKPLLCFSAGSVPIRSLSWAPDERDPESANLIVTAGHEGLKFWDIRDPYRPLWYVNPVQRIILSLDWLKEPRCLIWSYDDGTMRMLSLCKVANDLPVTGEIFCTTKQLGLHSYPCSPSAVWSIQVSRTTGVATYCTADGSTCCFQLTSKAVEKDPSRHREPHFLCGSLTKEDGVLKVNTPLPNVPLPKISSAMKHPQNELGDPRTLHNYLSDKNQATLAKVPVPDDPTPSKMKSTSKLGKCGNKKTDPGKPSDGSSIEKAEEGATKAVDSGDGSAQKKIEELPPKDVALHRVRWNMNEGSSRWLCYGGAAGIIRCQAIALQDMQQ